MGYYTDFTIETSHDKGITYLADVEFYGYHFKQMGNDKYILSIYEAKWYNHDRDMVDLSKRFPDLVFIVDGDGEEAGDFWRTFYKDGLFYSWKMDFEEIRKSQVFDQSKIDALKMNSALE